METSDVDDVPLTKRTTVFLFYGGMIVAAIGLFLLIRSLGEALPAPRADPVGVAIGGGDSINTLFHALLSLALIVVTARAVGGLFGVLGQPAVVGEVVG